MRICVVRGPLLYAVTFAMLITSCAGGSQAETPTPNPAESELSSSTKPTSTHSATLTEDKFASCVLTPAEVKAAFAEWIGPGEITITPEYSAPHTCWYTTPPNSLLLDGKGRIVPSTDTRSIQIDRTAYTDPVPKSAGIYSTKVTWGGATPEEVFASTEKAEKELAVASKRGAVVKTYPDIGGGAIFSGEAQITIATKADYWYTVGISGTKGDARYESAMVAIAKAINEKIAAGN
jgi:hypothetical protein